MFARYAISQRNYQRPDQIGHPGRYAIAQRICTIAQTVSGRPQINSLALTSTAGATLGQGRPRSTLRMRPISAGAIYHNAHSPARRPSLGVVRSCNGGTGAAGATVGRRSRAVAHRQSMLSPARAPGFRRHPARLKRIYATSKLLQQCHNEKFGKFTTAHSHPSKLYKIF
jgi:hypothetical protein